MRFRRSIGTSLLCCLWLAGCADSVGEEVLVYAVRPHDTLYSIAWRHDLDFRDLARWNHIGPEFRISVGQVLTLRPGNGSAAAASTAPPRRPMAPTRALGATAPASSAQRWVFPTDHGTQPIAVSGSGILLSGVVGQEVRAASRGRVVYTGSGLRGYGNLIIIKHDNSLLSAYAHNREMLVREGQDVAGGQVIAHMGEGAQRTPSLYFEIRQNGKPIDPLPLILPK